MTGAYERLSLAGRVIIITGAAGGLGGATAKLCAARGAALVLADINDGGGEAVLAEIRRDGGDAVYAHADVTSERDVEAMVDLAVARFGKLDGAFNNAGIAEEMGPVAGLATTSWQRHLDVNLTGVFLCMKYQIPRMLAGGGGAIVNTASVAGVAGTPGGSPYNASKHGVIGVTRAAALELAMQNVRVNAVLPGSIDTPMIQSLYQRHPEAHQAVVGAHPIGRLGQPWEIAETVAWLLSEAASFATGSAIIIDGGYSAR